MRPIESAANEVAAVEQRKEQVLQIIGHANANQLSAADAARALGAVPPTSEEIAHADYKPLTPIAQPPVSCPFCGVPKPSMVVSPRGGKICTDCATVISGGVEAARIRGAIAPAEHPTSQPAVSAPPPEPGPEVQAIALARTSAATAAEVCALTAQALAGVSAEVRGEVTSDSLGRVQVCADAALTLAEAAERLMKIARGA